MTTGLGIRYHHISPAVDRSLSTKNTSFYYISKRISSISSKVDIFNEKTEHYIKYITNEAETFDADCRQKSCNKSNYYNYVINKYPNRINYNIYTPKIKTEQTAKKINSLSMRITIIIT